MCASIFHILKLDAHTFQVHHLIFQEQRSGRKFGRKKQAVKPCINITQRATHMECVIGSNVICSFMCRKSFVSNTMAKYRICATVCHARCVSLLLLLLFSELCMLDGKYFCVVCAFRTESFINYISNVAAYGPCLTPTTTNKLLDTHTYRNDEKQLTRSHTHIVCMCNDFQVWSLIFCSSLHLRWIFQFFNLSMYQKFSSGYLHRTCYFIGFGVFFGMPAYCSAFSIAASRNQNTKSSTTHQ